MSDPAHVEDVIERPQDLGLPPEAEEVFDHLTEHGAENFSRDIIQALFRAQAKGNLRPVRDVVEAWYRSLLMVMHPDYDDMVEWARADDEPKQTYPADRIVEHYANKG
jgi:hypothetical protein